MTQEKILVIKLSALGDFIQALGPMAAIRKHHSSAHITLLTTPPFVKMGQDCSYFDDVWVDNRPKFYDLFGLLKLRKGLIGATFSRVYDLQNNDRTQFYLWLMTPCRPQWVGAAFGASHRNASKLRNAGKAFDGHRQTLEMAGLKDVTIDSLEWMKSDISKFNLESDFILIVPGCAPNRLEKRWPADCYIQLCHKLKSKNKTPVLIGTHAEKDIIDQISVACPFAKNLTGQTNLYDIAALGHAAAGAIGNDTGPMHLLSVTGCKTLMIFSTGYGSNPQKHGPLGANSKCISAKNIDSITADQVVDEFFCVSI